MLQEGRTLGVGVVIHAVSEWQNMEDYGACIFNSIVVQIKKFKNSPLEWSIVLLSFLLLGWCHMRMWHGAWGLQFMVRGCGRRWHQADLELRCHHCAGPVKAGGPMQLRIGCLVWWVIHSWCPSGFEHGVLDFDGMACWPPVVNKNFLKACASSFD